MSYDLWLEDENGKSLCEGHNYTSNVGPLFYKHLGLEGRGLHEINGVPAHEALPFFVAFWNSLHAESLALWKSDAIGEPALCAKYDAPNRWGSLVGAMLFIARFQSECIKYPYATVRLSA
jgi:hypothetical protein